MTSIEGMYFYYQGLQYIFQYDISSDIVKC